MDGPQDRLHRQIQSADAAQGVLDPLALGGELFRVSHVAKTAAAALGVIGTVGSQPVGGWSQDLHHMAPDSGAAYLIQIDPAGLAPQAARHKDGRAVQPGDAGAIAGIGVYGQCLYGVFRHPIHETRYSFRAE